MAIAAMREERNILNRRRTQCRRLRAGLTIVMLLLLQIFNEMDWNCACHSHFSGCDDNCRTEHRTEIACRPNPDDLLETVLLSPCTERVPVFFVFMQQEDVPYADCRWPLFRVRAGSAGPPPEEPVPRRC